MDISSNSSAESENCKKESSEREKDETETPNQAPAEEEIDFKSEIDLFADLERSLSDDYKKFLFG